MIFNKHSALEGQEPLLAQSLNLLLNDVCL